ncbi:UNKNOWN [Stylonychia lemnae]|uniref:Uncharacterized protein n=1 Tax=Stylonychia lemnae TaxID=5949 RepID=A0A078A0H2_STYLE|nr:UNKNOWN [Stylonychia lemnae]|eukprot:CDW75342.1 UNKNOWN [Stylonychia lemnae]
MQNKQAIKHKLASAKFKQIQNQLTQILSNSKQWAQESVIQQDEIENFQNVKEENFKNTASFNQQMSANKNQQNYINKSYDVKDIQRIQYTLGTYSDQLSFRQPFQEHNQQIIPQKQSSNHQSSQSKLIKDPEIIPSNFQKSKDNFSPLNLHKKNKSQLHTSRVSHYQNPYKNPHLVNQTNTEDQREITSESGSSTCRSLVKDKYGRMLDEINKCHQLNTFQSGTSITHRSNDSHQSMKPNHQRKGSFCSLGQSRQNQQKQINEGNSIRITTENSSMDAPQPQILNLNNLVSQQQTQPIREQQSLKNAYTERRLNQVSQSMSYSSTNRAHLLVSKPQGKDIQNHIAQKTNEYIPTISTLVNQNVPNSQCSFDDKVAMMLDILVKNPRNNEIPVNIDNLQQFACPTQSQESYRLNEQILDSSSQFQNTQRWDVDSGDFNKLYLNQASERSKTKADNNSQQSSRKLRNVNINLGAYQKMKEEVINPFQQRYDEFELKDFTIQLQKIPSPMNEKPQREEQKSYQKIDLQDFQKFDPMMCKTKDIIQDEFQDNLRQFVQSKAQDIVYRVQDDLKQLSYRSNSTQQTQIDDELNNNFNKTIDSALSHNKMNQTRTFPDQQKQFRENSNVTPKQTRYNDQYYQSNQKSGQSNDQNANQFDSIQNTPIINSCQVMDFDIQLKDIRINNKQDNHSGNKQQKVLISENVPKLNKNEINIKPLQVKNAQNTEKKNKKSPFTSKFMLDKDSFINKKFDVIQTHRRQQTQKINEQQRTAILIESDQNQQKQNKQPNLRRQDHISDNKNQTKKTQEVPQYNHISLQQYLSTKSNQNQGISPDKFLQQFNSPYQNLKKDSSEQELRISGTNSLTRQVTSKGRIQTKYNTRQSVTQQNSPIQQTASKSPYQSQNQEKTLLQKQRSNFSRSSFKSKEDLINRNGSHPSIKHTGSQKSINAKLKDISSQLNINQANFFQNKVKQLENQAKQVQSSQNIAKDNKDQLKPQLSNSKSQSKGSFFMLQKTPIANKQLDKKNVIMQQNQDRLIKKIEEKNRKIQNIEKSKQNLTLSANKTPRQNKSIAREKSLNKITSLGPQLTPILQKQNQDENYQMKRISQFQQQEQMKLDNEVTLFNTQSSNVRTQYESDKNMDKHIDSIRQSEGPKVCANIISLNLSRNNHEKENTNEAHQQQKSISIIKDIEIPLQSAQMPLQKNTKNQHQINFNNNQIIEPRKEQKILLQNQNNSCLIRKQFQ